MKKTSLIVLNLYDLILGKLSKSMFMRKYLCLYFFILIPFFLFGQYGRNNKDFANNGIGIYNLGYGSIGKSMFSEMQADGKLLVAGTYDVDDNYLYGTCLARLNPDGTLDSSFGKDGIVYLGIGEIYDYPLQMLNDKKGRIIVNVSSYYMGKYDSYNYGTIFRLNSNGDLDSTFSVDGILDTKILSGLNTKIELIDDTLRYFNSNKMYSIGEQGQIAKTTSFEYAFDKYVYSNNRFFTFPSNGYYCYIYDRDGKLITQVSGLSFPGYQISRLSAKPLDSQKLLISGYLVNDNNDFGVFICKMAFDGKIDTTFGNKGVYVINNIKEWDIYPLKNGNFMGFSTNYGLDSTFTNISLIRSNGIIDSTYGKNGTATFTSQYFVSNKIDSLGSVYITGGTDKFSIYKMTLNGSADLSFGELGMTELTVGKRTEKVNDLIISKEDKIILLDDQRIVRLDKHGHLDSTFNSVGVKDLINVGHCSIGKTQIDGKIIILSRIYESDYNKHFIFRLTEDGRLDSTFGVNGVVEIYSANNNTFIPCLEIQNDGKIVLGGDNLKSILFWRLNSNGTFDQSFGINGLIQYSINGIEDWVSDLKIDSEGKIVVLGGTLQNEKISPHMNAPVKKVLIIRLLENGTVDYSFNGQTGMKIIDLPGSPEMNYLNDYGNQLSLLPDDEIVFLGSSANQNKYFYSITKLNKGGSPKSNYGNAGTQIYNNTDFAKKTIDRFEIQRDGKVIFFGLNVNDGKKDTYFYRETSVGLPDTTFGDNGFSYQLFEEYSLRATSVVVNSKAQIIGAGTIRGDYFVIGLTSKFSPNLQIIMPATVSINTQIPIRYTSMSNSSVTTEIISSQSPAEIIDNNLVTYSSPGTIMLKATQPESEIYTAESTFYEIEISTSVNIKEELSNQIVVYPIPAKEIINIANTTEGEKVTVLNNVGQVIYEGRSTSNSTTIYLGKLNS
ncbi:MAG: hypothetical protein NVV82_22595 [Sporocytophaga sp.]|nr:hypothetical protein [Sporocytophaga sp.]